MSNLTNGIKRFFIANEPDILIGIGITGLVYSTYAGVYSTIKACKKFYNHEEIFKNKKAVVKKLWPLYLPSMISIAVSIPCILAGHKISTRRTAALATAFTLSETALQEYQTKAKEIVGERKERDIRDAANKEIVNKNYNSNSVIVTGDGDSIFYEPITGRFFKSSWNKIQKAANDLNADALSGNDQITLTDWFDRLGLESTDISDQIGWNVYNGRNSLIDISLGSCMLHDNVPCASISYSTQPTYL